LNIWAGKGAPPPPPNAVGLLAFSICVPDLATLQFLKDRLRTADFSIEKSSAAMGQPTILTRDQDGNGVEIMVE
jgi:catechol 2,3-dioxygenase